MSKRTINACMNCRETREIAAHGLCFTCYRQEERREKKDLWLNPGAAAKELAAAQKKTRKALMKMMDALGELQEHGLVGQSTLDMWRSLLKPEVARIADCLTPLLSDIDEEEMPYAPVHRKEPVYSEQIKPSEQFTPSQPARVNSEQEKESEQFTLPPMRPQRITKVKIETNAYLQEAQRQQRREKKQAEPEIALSNRILEMKGKA